MWSLTGGTAFVAGDVLDWLRLRFVAVLIWSAVTVVAFLLFSVLLVYVDVLALASVLIQIISVAVTIA